MCKVVGSTTYVQSGPVQPMTSKIGPDARMSTFGDIARLLVMTNVVGERTVLCQQILLCQCSWQVVGEKYTFGNMAERELLCERSYLT